MREKKKEREREIEDIQRKTIDTTREKKRTFSARIQLRMNKNYRKTEKERL